MSLARWPCDTCFPMQSGALSEQAKPQRVEGPRLRFEAHRLDPRRAESPRRWSESTGGAPPRNVIRGLTVGPLSGSSLALALTLDRSRFGLRADVGPRGAQRAQPGHRASRLPHGCLRGLELLRVERLLDELDQQVLGEPVGAEAIRSAPPQNRSGWLQAVGANCRRGAGRRGPRTVLSAPALGPVGIGAESSLGAHVLDRLATPVACPSHRTPPP